MVSLCGCYDRGISQGAPGWHCDDWDVTNLWRFHLVPPCQGFENIINGILNILNSPCTFLKTFSYWGESELNTHNMPRIESNQNGGDVCEHMHACVQRRICGWQGDGVRDITSHTDGDDNGLSLSVCRQWDGSDDRHADVFNCSCSEPESRQRKIYFHTADGNTSSTGVLKDA